MFNIIYIIGKLSRICKLPPYSDPEAHFAIQELQRIPLGKSDPLVFFAKLNLIDVRNSHRCAYLVVSVWAAYS